MHVIIITGGIPTEIGELWNLEMLSISSASLTGNIPISIFKLLFLKVINLSNNSLTGSIPAGSSYSLPQIQHLYLSSNHLTGIYNFYLVYVFVGFGSSISFQSVIRLDSHRILKIFQKSTFLFM